MAPVLQDRDFNLDVPAANFRQVWSSPSNYAFTILLLVGGNVVSRALAQLAGGRFTPVAFSFGEFIVYWFTLAFIETSMHDGVLSMLPINVHHTGWVSYATAAVNSAVGENKLMPPSDTPCKVINVENGQSRGNGSWVLGRTMRDFEYWMEPTVRAKVAELKKSKYQYDVDEARKKGQDADSVEYPAHAGLVVSFWKFDENKKDRLKKPGRDLLFWSGIAITVVQLGIAAIPLGVFGNWGVFLVTVAAQILCYTTGFWKQWGREKWACRHIPVGKRRTFILVSANKKMKKCCILLTSKQ